MAEKKASSRAEKAVSTAKKNNTKSNGKQSASDTGSKTSASGSKKMIEAHNQKQSVLPARVTAAIITLILFVLFLVIGIKPEGVLLLALRNLMLSMIGMAAFYFSIPGLLYIFYILLTSRKKPVRMRCICVIVFVLLCGSLYHLIVNNQTLVGGTQIFADLLTSGKNGTSGGLICGGFAMIIKSLLGVVVTYILLIVSAILTLMAAMKITIPSIVKAIQERPREDWDDDDFEDSRPEPAENQILVQRKNIRLSILPEKGLLPHAHIRDEYDVPLNAGEPDKYHVSMPPQFHLAWQTESRQTHEIQVRFLIQREG